MRKNILISLLTLFLFNVQILASGVDWKVNVYDFQYDMTAYVALHLEGENVADLSSYTVAAFCDDECRGVMDVRSVDNNEYGYLRIRSNQSKGETITFKVYDPISDRIALSTNQIVFQSQQVIGYPSSPFVVEAEYQNWEPEFITICNGDSFVWDKSGKTYTESGIYTTIYNNRQATLHLTVNPIAYSEVHITACDRYDWNGLTYTQTGEYIYTTVAANGCDSIITLHLTINKSEYEDYTAVACDEYVWHGVTYTESGDYTYNTTTAAGCERVETLHLTINQTQYAEEIIIACDSYSWNGKTYTQSGEYVYTTVAANGCDSIVTLHLTINQTKHAEETITACDSYTWNGETYTGSGEYTYTTTAANGCDSIVTLHLTINQTKHTEESITACDSYTWNGEIYTGSGEYTYTTTAANGCDSIVTLHLTINQTQYAEESITACDSYTWNAETYTTSGDYVYTTVAANGCDSIVTLHLTINQTQYAEESVTACDSYAWNGETYTTSGDYVYTTVAANGCDSIVTLHLTINQTQYAEKSVTACDSYAWNGEIYTESGDYVYTTTASNGCDSIVTLHLTINHSEVAAPEYATICHGETYTWNGQTYSAEGEYSVTLQNALGCDSIVTLHLTINQTKYAEESITACDSYTWNSETYTESGDYTYTTTASNGCDSIVTLHLTINHSEVSAPEYATICHGETYTWNGQTYSTEGEYSVTLQNALGCDSVASLHLTIMPAAITTTETVVIGSDELPYAWRGNTYTATGRYTDVEQYATIACDSAIHVLDLTVLNTDNYDEQSVTICETEAPYLWYGESYSATGKYTYTEKYAGTDIDSIQYILNLTVNPTVYTEEHITACDSYTWNGESYTESGDYVYTTTASNGCDSIVTLHLTINQTQYAEKSVTACDSYAWNGETYTESGDYVYTTTASNGCDSIVTLHLTINHSEVAATEYATICHGETYTWNGQTYSTEGEYSVTLQNALGCDSVAILHLTIMPAAITTTETVVIGSDELPYVWRGNTYSVTGRYTDIEQYATIACDSAIHVLDLTVLTTGNYDEQSVTICETETPYIWYGESYSTTGKYTYAEKYVGTDIDSVQHILNLTVNPTVYTEETITACDSYTWNGETYTTSGDYIYTTVAANGCDSIVTLHLTINPTKHTEEIITACDSYTWNGEIYTESGDYVYTTAAANGCDSILTLHLTINYSEVATPEYATICHGETYTWNGQTYSTEGEYNVTLQNALGCDSVATLHLTIMPAAVTTTETVVIGSDELPYSWRGQSITATDRYTDIEQYTNVACDSAIHVLDLIVLTTGALDEQSATICDSEVPYMWYGESYTATGKYTYTEKYVGTDIDSVQHILNLTVNPTVYTEETITACDGYTWNGETYTQSGNYIYTTVATNGCDSIVTLHLTINQTKYTEETITACDGYTWNGETYTQSGDYVYTIVAANGCDSIAILHLTILPDAVTEREELVLCPSELPYEWNGLSIAEAGEYSMVEQYAIGCDSVIHELILNVFVQTLPEQVTLPVVRVGEPIDVTIPTEDILAHIALQTWYAPNASVAWYVKDNTNWSVLSTEPVMTGTTEVVLKYVIDSDCDSIESEPITIIIQATALDAVQSTLIETYKVIRDEQVLIIRNGEIYNTIGLKVVHMQ